MTIPDLQAKHQLNEIRKQIQQYFRAMYGDDWAKRIAEQVELLPAMDYWMATVLSGEISAGQKIIDGLTEIVSTEESDDINTGKTSGYFARGPVGIDHGAEPGSKREYGHG